MVDTIKEVTFSSQRIKEISPGMWQDFHSDLHPSLNSCIYYNDFNAWVPDEWTITSDK